jgi:hypothetical protein
LEVALDGALLKFLLDEVHNPVFQERGDGAACRIRLGA